MRPGVLPHLPAKLYDGEGEMAIGGTYPGASARGRYPVIECSARLARPGMFPIGR